MKEIFSTRVTWSKRVPPHKITRLYESDAQGRLDEDLLDEVGYTISACCQDFLIIMEANRGRVACRSCGEIIQRRLVDGKFDSAEILKCPRCSWQIAPGDYHKSLLRKTPAPPYEPEAIFRSFARQWAQASSASEKMLLIDGLVHAFHIHLGTVGWPLGTTVIQASAGQMAALLEALACGAGSTDGLRQNRERWNKRRIAQQMRFDLQRAARDLGITGAQRMRKEELVEAIAQADPHFFEPWLALVDEA